MATKIDAYKAKDGTVFESLAEAESHDCKCDFIENYDSRQDGQLWASGSQGKVYGDELAEWLLKNKAYILKFYGVIKS